MNDEDKDCWPDFYPAELQLPPDDAMDASGTVYRFVRAIPPTEDCFLATHQEQPSRHKTCRTPERQQAVYGTSVWTSQEFLLEVLAALPQGMGTRILACGTVNARMGKMRSTQEEGHLTLWLRKNSNIHLNFSEVK